MQQPGEGVRQGRGETLAAARGFWGIGLLRNLGPSWSYADEGRLERKLQKGRDPVSADEKAKHRENDLTFWGWSKGKDGRFRHAFIRKIRMLWRWCTELAAIGFAFLFVLRYT